MFIGMAGALWHWVGVPAMRRAIREEIGGEVQRLQDVETTVKEIRNDQIKNAKKYDQRFSAIETHTSNIQTALEAHVAWAKRQQEIYSRDRKDRGLVEIPDPHPPY